MVLWGKFCRNAIFHSTPSDSKERDLQKRGRFSGCQFVKQQWGLWCGCQFFKQQRGVYFGAKSPNKWGVVDFGCQCVKQNFHQFFGFGISPSREQLCVQDLEEGGGMSRKRIHWDRWTGYIFRPRHQINTLFPPPPMAPFFSCPPQGVM